MLYTIVNPDDVFYRSDEIKQRRAPSTNPYDYLRPGYYLDNAALFGGKNHVNYHIHFPGDTAGHQLYTAHQ